MKFDVEGVPIPKGSTRAFVVNGKASTTNANPKTKVWQYRIAHEAQAARDGEFIPKTGKGDDGVIIDIAFRLPKPKSTPKSHKRMTKKPDLDKLIRTVLDALTGVVFDDDSQVTMISASKGYAEPGHPPSVTVFVEAAK